MEYVVAINRPKRGDIIPLIDVAEAMAKHASTAYGERTMHSPTLDAIRPQRVEMLMAAAKHGAIKVCSNDGAMGDAEALIQASPLPQFFSIEGVATSEILALHVTSQHLAEWGKATGNTFQVVNINGKSVEFGPLLRPDLILTQGLKLFEAEFGAASRSDFGGAHAGQIVGRA